MRRRAGSRRPRDEGEAKHRIMADPTNRPIHPLLIAIPILDDWESVDPLIRGIGRVLASGNLRASVLVVDDGSTERPARDFLSGDLGGIDGVEVLELNRNLGQQRAIAVAMVWIRQNRPDATLLIMDGDGQDRAEDIPRLLARFDAGNGRAIVFAERTRRSESPLFQFFYHLYRVVHVILTGYRVRVGNFSVLPGDLAEGLVVTPELWNHYAASVLRGKLPHVLVPTHRGKRLRGRSRMNFVSLVTHGLSAISVYGEIVGTRLLVMAGLLIAVALAAVGGMMALAFLSETVVPWWGVFSLGAVAVLALQSGTMAAAFAFLTLGSRHYATFLPIRDCGYFVGRLWKVGGGGL